MKFLHLTEAYSGETAVIVADKITTILPVSTSKHGAQSVIHLSEGGMLEVKESTQDIIENHLYSA